MKQLVYSLAGLLFFSCQYISKTDINYNTKSYLEVANILATNPPDNFPIVIKLKAGYSAQSDPRISRQIDPLYFVVN
jgi:hypothetical protein